MVRPRILILRAPGTNCDSETAHAFELAGGVTELMHVNRVLEKAARLRDFQVLCIPGGFSYGDDIAAGRIFGSQIQHHLADTLKEFREAGKLIIGICNGFQVLLKTNLLAATDGAGPKATLAANDSGHFEARWVRLVSQPEKCVFLSGVEELELPVAHGEGKFVTRDDSVFARMSGAGQFVLRYTAAVGAHPESAIRNSQSEITPSVPYPANPNGTRGDVAGICDETGRVFGLMPHPERFVDWTQHPRWTREPARPHGDGLRIFENAMRYFN
ncbi:MAG TPA: phosphoribosylformylglycinamidine synthase subunit PurQ [Lacipirellulaceae bacterium]|jgi:phosphoribosylformylglycinamidine synthase|nr:phosphoribosylformylglycinamidine synthase subunit PurQ [Lacipirellulaceae bacterium]